MGTGIQNQTHATKFDGERNLYKISVSRAELDPSEIACWKHGVVEENPCFPCCNARPLAVESVVGHGCGLSVGRDQLARRGWAMLMPLSRDRLMEGVASADVEREFKSAVVLVNGDLSRSTWVPTWALLVYFQAIADGCVGHLALATVGRVLRKLAVDKDQRLAFLAAWKLLCSLSSAYGADPADTSLRMWDQLAGVA